MVLRRCTRGQWWGLLFLLAWLGSGTAQAVLQLYWSFDDGTATDQSGNGNNGTLLNSPTTTTGQVGQALQFNGTNQAISFAAPRQANNTAFSIAIWFKTSSSANQKIYWESAGASFRLYLAVNENVAGDVEFAMRDDAIVTIGCATGALSLNDGQWHLAIAVQTSKSARELFVDDVSRCTNSTTLGTFTPDASYVGTQNNTAAWANGALDQVRTYNHALSPAERTALFTEGTALLKRRVVVY